MITGSGRNAARPWTQLAFFTAGFLVVLASTQDEAIAEDEHSPSISYYSFFNGWGTNPYSLDHVERFLSRGERLPCSPEDTVRHRGTHFRYRIRVSPALVPRLERFEELVVELANSQFGRPPRRMAHKGGFACRAARGRRGRVSEHALGNALDVEGFDFGPVARASATELPRRLRRGFRIRMSRHWTPRHPRDAPLARFLHNLAEAVRARPEIFRGIVGPPQARHSDHLHLDVAPWRYAMFGYDPIE